MLPDYLQKYETTRFIVNVLIFPITAAVILALKWNTTIIR